MTSHWRSISAKSKAHTMPTTSIIRIEGGRIRRVRRQSREKRRRIRNSRRCLQSKLSERSREDSSKVRRQSRLKQRNSPWLRPFVSTLELVQRGQSAYSSPSTSSRLCTWFLLRKMMILEVTQMKDGQRYPKMETNLVNLQQNLPLSSKIVNSLRRRTLQRRRRSKTLS